MGIFDSIKSLTGNTQVAPPPTEQIIPKKILIVEDDQLIREFYAELLTGSGYTIIQAENGQVGLDTLTAQKPNLVLLDLMMPVMDGVTMLHKMREIPEFKTTPVIVLTNAGDTDNIRQTKFYDHANDFLIKSNIDPQDLLRKVKSLL